MHLILKNLVFNNLIHKDAKDEAIEFYKIKI